MTNLADEADATVTSALYPTTLAEATSAAVGPSPAGGPPEAGGVGPGAISSSTNSTGSAAGGGRGPSAREAGAAAARRRAARMRAHSAKLATSLHGISMEAWGLQRVLDKKRDPTTRALLDVAVRVDRTAGLSDGAYSAYWDGLCRAVRGAVQRALIADGVNLDAAGNGLGSGVGGAAMVAMYPYLRKAFLHLMKRLEEGTRGSQSARRGDSGASATLSSTASSISGTTTSTSLGRGASWLRTERANGSGGVGNTGILGGSRWLSLVLDNDADASSEDEFETNLGKGRRFVSAGGDAAGGAKNASEPTGIGSLQDSSGVRRGGKIGLGSGLAVRGAERHAGIGTDGNTGRGDDGERLLEALGPLRDLFLARSLERLTTPVEQMFPQVTLEQFGISFHAKKFS